MYCHNCGHKNPEGANFCSSCGKVLEASEARRGSAGEETTVTYMPDDGIEAADEELAADLSELKGDDALLIVKRGSNVGARFLLDQDCVAAGRHQDSEIFLDDITVSRRHAEFVRAQGGWVVRDSGSLNGTYLNRDRIDEAKLSSGDEVQIGKYKFVFLTGSGG